MKIADTFGPGTASHQPLIRATMEVYSPRFVLELGIGLYSTPLFCEYKTSLTGIDNSMEWVSYMKERYSHEILFHSLGDKNINTRLSSLTLAQRHDIYNYYNTMILPTARPNLLFVDQWASCRTLSINALSDKFDLVMYHDSEPAGVDFMEYDLISVKGFHRYTLKTSTAWTTLLVREDKGFELLNEKILPHIEGYKALNNETYMELTHENDS